MVHAVRVYRVGGPEVLTYEEIEVPAPGQDEIRIRQEACGVNFVDVYFRMGMYPAPLPFIAGAEGAGEVIAVGNNVTDLKPGDRVAYTHAFGGYAQERLLPAARAVKLPSTISYVQGASMMMKGMTAECLLRRVFRVQKGQTVLIHAAAGGVGSITCQWAKHLGATVIGTVGSRVKAEIARKNGCDHPILYNEEDFAARVKEITKGDLCDVVYDGIGKATFPASLDCLRPRGMFVNFGNASGPVEAFNLSLLAQKGALYTTRPTLAAYTQTRDDLLLSANALIEVIESGAVKIEAHQTFALRDAEKAHRALEGRETAGASILIP